MNVLIVNHSDFQGGAARAAYRLHCALRQNDVNSIMHVNNAGTDDLTVNSIKTKLAKAKNIIRPNLAAAFNRLLQTNNLILHSPALLNSYLPKILNKSHFDIINLHWVNGEMLSIHDIAKINKPVVWTLHDMWAFCGAEHVSPDFRWRDGYEKSNRPSDERGFDLNKWTWRRKKKYWARPIQIVTPSHWLKECVRQSSLMSKWPVITIPNPIDTEIWSTFDKVLARNLFQLPQDVPLILFGSYQANHAPHKGYDLLEKALELLNEKFKDFEIVIFGQMRQKESKKLGFPVHYIGHLHDNLSMKILYNAADILAIPSRIDNFPNTGVEAQACGVPVVAFDTCGLNDVVEHLHTGYLARPFNCEDFAAGIIWILENNARYQELRDNSRSRALQHWSYKVVSSQYIKLYSSILNNSC